MSEALDVTERSELARVAALSMRDQLDRVLDDRLERPKDRKPEWHEFVKVSSFDLTERCGRRAALPADDFIESIHNARRRVGLLVLRRAVQDGSDDLVAITRTVLDDPSGWPQGLWEWTRELEPAARGAIGSAALTWAAALARTIPAGTARAARAPRRTTVTWSDPAMPSRFEVPGRLIKLNGSFDASAGRPRAVVLMSVADGVPAASDRLRAGFVALVRTLQHQLAPVRVSLAAPSRGRIEPFAVDESLLQLTVDHVVEVVALRADPDRAMPRPSRACGHCHLLDDCPEGAAYRQESTLQVPTPVESTVRISADGAADKGTT